MRKGIVGLLVAMAFMAMPFLASAHGFSHGPSANVSGEASAFSQSAVGSANVAAVVGNGFAVNGNSTYANNQSEAGSTASTSHNTVEGATYSGSVGNSGSSAFGLQGGSAFGATGGFGVQTGAGAAAFRGRY